MVRSRFGRCLRRTARDLDLASWAIGYRQAETVQLYDGRNEI
jgi:hypothetical protein